MKLSKSALGAIVGVSLVAGMTTGLFADTIAKEIKATLDPTVSIVYNNQTVAMKDGSGNPVYPILYNGSTYVPIRAVSDIFSTSTDWDGDTRTVYLGGKGNQGDPVSLAKLMGSGNEYCWKIVETSELKVTGDSGDATFSSGIARDIWNATGSSGKYTLVPIDVSGKSILTFTVWSDIDATILIMDENGGVITSFKNSKGSIVSKEIDISGYSKIALGANSQTDSVRKGTAKFFDPMVK